MNGLRLRCLSRERDRRTLQLQSTKQLSIRGDDDGGETHRDCANAHGKIESPADENACCDRDGDKVSVALDFIVSTRVLFAS